MAVHILGIRHHGVGSAKNVLAYLQKVKPDIILIEGPPEISESLSFIGESGLIPPVAIMVYDEKETSKASFYPFAEFSPEWVAAQFAHDNKIKVKALDLPARNSFDLEKEEYFNIQEGGDPLFHLAFAAGFDSTETWWEYQFEQKGSNLPEEHFESVMYAMSALRTEGILSSFQSENDLREAYMRLVLQQTINELYENIVVVCGAWHAPVLINIDKYAKEDQKLLKRQVKSKRKIESNWIPWTNSRLSMFSGYGAGLNSPGWYEHLWQNQEDKEIKWLTKIAEAFRKTDVDISTAHVLETYRLAYAIAALRAKYSISLAELNEAVSTVMCMGDSILFSLIQNEIIVGEKIGAIPDDFPKVPLQKDFETQSKSLRLSLSAFPKQLDLDLRKKMDLQRSIFFHRLELLEISWAKRSFSRSKGTFKESWILEWQPEMQINLIDKAFYGNTIFDACTALVYKKAVEFKLISELVDLAEKCLPGELFEAIDTVLLRINDESAISNDTMDIMKAVPKLVGVLKYGDVRKSDKFQLEKITTRLFNKVNITVFNACYGLDEDNSNVMFELISAFDHAIKIADNEDIETEWYAALEKFLFKIGIHHVIIGCIVRLLIDNNQVEEERAKSLFSYYLTSTNPPLEVAFWIEGFLRGSGSILLYDNRIWNLIYTWVFQVERVAFLELLPILRRSFSKFEFAERRKIGEKAKAGLFEEKVMIENKDHEDFDYEMAKSILPYIQKFLG